MASTRMAFGSLMGTITNIADTVSNTVNLVSQGVDMGNRFVEMAQQDQKERQVIHRVTYRDTIIREASMDMAKAKLEVVKFAAEDSNNAVAYTESEKSLLDAFAKFDAPSK